MKRNHRIAVGATASAGMVAAVLIALPSAAHSQTPPSDAVNAALTSHVSTTDLASWEFTAIRQAVAHHDDPSVHDQNDDRERGTEPGDDRGQATEPGDDRSVDASDVDNPGEHHGRSGGGSDDNDTSHRGRGH